MERLKERLGIAQRALQSLEELLVIEKPSRIERDAAIQRFEYTFEAAWKAAERFLLVVEGVAAASPKACMRISREAGLLSEEQAVVALEMVDDATSLFTLTMSNSRNGFTATWCGTAPSCAIG